MVDQPLNYPASCPSCGQINNLTDADLGVRLNCGACGSGFIFGEEIARQRRKEEKERMAKLAEAQRRRREEERVIEQHKKAERKRVEMAKAADFERLRESQRSAELALREKEQPPPQAVQVTYAPAVQAPAAIDVRKRFGRYGIICPNLNCGFVGKANEQTSNSSLRQLAAIALCTFIGLLFCFPVGAVVGFFLGLIIALFDSGKSRLICPRCGLQIRDV